MEKNTDESISKLLKIYEQNTTRINILEKIVARLKSQNHFNSRTAKGGYEEEEKVCDDINKNKKNTQQIEKACWL